MIKKFIINLILISVILPGLSTLYGTTTPFIKFCKPEYVGTTTIKFKNEGKYYIMILPNGQFYLFPKY